ncbi:MAG: hypothetical protein J6U23_06845 [Clostridiales bacterium]|nr:hypothetical protein [Clostridiales bacterium]
MSEYDDILHLNRPQYPDFPPMSIHDRAAQFSPFAALVGYDEAVAETVRYTDARREISEEELTDLNKKLNELKEKLSLRPSVTVHYFVPDSRKDGGSYKTKKGNVRTIDEYNNIIVFADGDKIAISDTYTIVFEE